MFFKGRWSGSPGANASEVEISSYEYERAAGGVEGPGPRAAVRRQQGAERGRRAEGFEIDIDESIKHLINSPEFCDSILLDVTLINPNSTDVIEKSALTGRQVRDMIESIEKQHNEKRRLINKILGSDDHSIDTIVKVTTHDKKIKTPCSELNRTNLLKGGAPPKRKRHHQDQPHHEEQSGGAKVCSSSAPAANDPHYFNCLTGMSVEVDPLFLDLKASLKNVEARINAMQENIEQSDENAYTNPKGCGRLYSKGGDYEVKAQQVYRTNRAPPHDLDLRVGCQNKPLEEGRPCLCGHCGTVGLLSEGQKFPVVAHAPDPKEVMKKPRLPPNSTPRCMDEKQAHYLSKLTERVKLLEDRLEMHEETLVTKEYFKRIITKVISHFTAKINGARYAAEERPHAAYRTFNYQVHNPRASMERTCESSDYESAPNQERFWKWGPEILRPGADLKNKILSLIDTTFKKKGKEKQPPKDDVSFFISDDLAASEKKVGQEEGRPSAFGKFTDFERKCVRDSLVRRDNSNGFAPESKRVNVAYVNPKLSTWYDESNPSIKEFPAASRPPQSDPKELEKSAFFKTLEKTKEADKNRLWQSIWNQAKLNNQTKEDKVTIQIPDQQKGKSVIEIEFTIGELEGILIKK